MKFGIGRIFTYSFLPIVAVGLLAYFHDKSYRGHVDAENLERFQCGGITSVAHVSGYMLGNRESISILVIWMGGDWDIVSCVTDIETEMAIRAQESMSEHSLRWIGDVRFDVAQFEELRREGVELGAVVFEASDKIEFIGLNRRFEAERNKVFTKNDRFNIVDGNVFYLDNTGRFFQTPFNVRWVENSDLDNVLRFLEPSLYGNMPLPNEIPDGILLELVVPK